MRALSPPPPVCPRPRADALAAYCARRKQLFRVIKGSDQRRSVVVAANGAKACMQFKRRLLWELSRHRPRMPLAQLLDAVPPPDGLMPSIHQEVGALERSLGRQPQPPACLPA